MNCRHENKSWALRWMREQALARLSQQKRVPRILIIDELNEVDVPEYLGILDSMAEAQVDDALLEKSN